MLAADIHFAPAALFYLLDMLGVMFLVARPDSVSSPTPPMT
jgi:uncharacterized membrane protein